MFQQPTSTTQQQPPEQGVNVPAPPAQLHAAVQDTLRPSITQDVVTTNYRYANTYLRACIDQEDIICIE